MHTKQIKKLVVRKLFGTFDYEILLNKNPSITIVHGPNGFGKTALLRILYYFSTADYVALEDTSFESFSVDFNDGSRAKVNKKIESGKVVILFEFCNSIGEKETFSSERIRKEVSVLSEGLHRYSPDLEKIDDNHWKDNRKKELLSLNESILRYVPTPLYEETGWCRLVCYFGNRIPVHLVESQRLLNFTRSYKLGDSTTERPISSTVSRYSEELSELMQEKLKEYGTTSQSLDRTFPFRIMQQDSSIDIKEEQLQDQIRGIEKMRAQLVEVGLLEREIDSERTIQSQHIDRSTRNTLSVYVEDVEKKLTVFKDVAQRIQLLRKIINKKFSYSQKEVKFSKERGFFFETHRNTTEPRQLLANELSSGEQHELVLLYELLFKVKPNSLVLIDEPELSLHVTWQAQFLQDLQEIMKLTDISVLIATHSPDIIQDRWDLTVSLSEEAE